MTEFLLIDCQSVGFEYFLKLLSSVEKFFRYKSMQGSVNLFIQLQFSFVSVSVRQYVAGISMLEKRKMTLFCSITCVL